MISQATANPQGSVSQSAKDGERRACPMSFAQSRLWILDRFQPGNPTYNIATSVPLYGRVDTRVLERTINEIIRRHEALRTTFEVVDGQPAQVVKASLKIPLNMVDLRSRSGVAREEDVDRFIYAESRRPFDLKAGPLLHASLVQLNANQSFLMLVMHHIVSDGWSMSVLNRELTTIYMAFLNGRPSPLPELTVQYPDFAVWQADWFRGEPLQKQLRYWRDQLSGLRPVLNLPTDRRRPPVRTSNGSVRGFTLDEKLCEALKALGNANRASLFMTLLAALKVLLHRLSGETDIAIGSPIANRTRSELEGLIGFFVNTLVLRTDLSGDPSFVELLVRERNVALDAYSNQDMPFEKLVDVLQLDRDLSHNPFFQILFGVQNIGAIDRSSAPIQPLGSQILAGSVGNGTAKFDLTMSVVDTGAGAQGFLEFNTDLFDDSTVDTMIARYIALLHRIVENPNETLSRLSIWIADEAVPAMGSPDDAEVAAVPAETMGARIAAHAARTPTAIATIESNGTSTYFELNQRANRAARTSFLAQLSAGSTVAVACGTGSGWLAVVLAILKAGLVWAPIDPADVVKPDGGPLNSDRAERILAALRPALVVVDAATEPCFGKFGVEAVRIEALWDEAEDQPDGELEISLTPDAPAVALARIEGATETATVRLSHRMLGRAGYDRFLRLSPEDRVAHLSNIASDCARYEIFGALSAGAAIVFVPPELSLRSRRFAALLQETSATVLPIAMADLERLTREFPRSLRNVQLVLSAERQLDWGELQQVLPPEILERVHMVSGDPSAGGFYLIQPLALLDPEAAEIPLGVPACGVDVRLLGSVLDPMPERVPGDLYVQHPDLPDPDPGYRTEDFVRLEDGQLVLHGGMEDALLTGNLKTYFAEIEAMLCGHPAVVAAAVTARPRQGLADRGVIAFLDLSQNVSASDLQSFFAERLPARLMPAKFELGREIPYDSKGAIDRRALTDAVARLEAPMASAEKYVAPRDNLEIHLTQIWMDVLHTDLVGIRDNFFRLGGHSLIATQIVARINDTLQVEIPLQRLFEAPTIEQLAALIKPMVGSDPQPQVTMIARVDRDRPIPLSFAQRRLWFLDQFDPNSAVYNIALPVHFSGPVDVAMLEGALNDLIARHETLRTTFSTVEGNPVQVISPSLQIKIPVHDLRRVPAKSRKVELQRLITQQAQMPFDLKNGPVLRGELICLSNNENLLLVTIHHIAADGWSMEIISRELLEFYDARRRRRPSSLPELPIQYADFACWQHRYLSSPLLQRDAKYWKDKLQGMPPLLELPADRSRPAMQSFTGGMYMFALPPSLLKGVKSFSEREQVTLFTTLLSAFYILLYRYTGREDLVVGSPIANRVRPELEGLIGFITNTLVLRTQFSANSSFRALVSEVREVTMDAFTHQGIPFERLVEEIQPERNLSYNPLFQVMFALQNTGRPVDVGGAPDEETPTLSAGVSKFDLSMFLSETAKDFSAGIEYNSDLFDLSTVERFAGHFSALLTAALDEPDRPIWSLPMLLPSETTAITAWNDTEDPNHSEICHVLFEKQAALLPDEVALVAGGEKTTYRELNSRANALAHRLIELGVKPGSRVAICIERGVDMIVALIATLKAGAAYVPIDPAYPKERIAFIAADANVTLVLTQSALSGELAGASGTLIAVDELKTPAIACDNPDVPVAAGCLAYIIYTSGSTGKPKGVVMPHGSLASLIRWQTARSALPTGAPTLQFASLSFDVSFQEIFSTLGAGGTLLLINEDQRRDPPALWELLHEEDVRRLFMPYVALQQLAEHARHAPALPQSLTELITAGEQLQVTPQIAEMITRLGADLYNQYGPTESHVVTELKLTGAPSDWPARPPIGRMLPNTTVQILDPHGQQCPIGIPGELCIGGAALAHGYLEKRALTAERFIPDAQSTNGGRLYLTGDRARFLANGELEFLGRSDQQVKIRGYRVELGEVEVALRTHPSVKEAVVVARENRGELRLVGYIQADAESSVSTEDLRAHLRTILPEHMIPTSYVIMESLPLTPSGKLSRSNLPDPHEAASRPIIGAVPSTPVEIALARLWSEILQVDKVGVKDNFFELGGHSLLATRVVSWIRDEFGVDLPVRLMFDNPTVEALALATVEGMLETRGDDQIARLLADLEQMPEEAATA
ncbi:amino acid adenylation domain-containing protein [Sinorhizobium meliloti]|nr:amino acid adenylation domain-containing protein [Sinorhizobium meliloti]WQP35930.1 amino acid adenylation domain-containing protein [Sinorhizobium meliloti]